MKNILMLLILMLWGFLNSSVSAQIPDLPSNKYGNSFEKFEKLKQAFKYTYIGYGYHQTNFLNTTFSKYVADGSIKKDWGHSFHAGYKRYGYFIDVNYFMSKFTLTDSYGGYYYFKDTADVAIKHRGLDISLSVRLIPSTKKWTKYVNPYFGVGYSLSNLVGEANFELKSKTKTNSMLWKAGIDFSLAEYYMIRAEYKQTGFGDLLSPKYPFQEFTLAFMLCMY